MGIKGWIGIGVLFAALAAIWLLFAQTGTALLQLDQKIEAASNLGDPDYQLPDLRSERDNLEGQRVLNGIILTLLTSALVGILFAVFVLPPIVSRVTDGIFGSGAPAEPDPMHDARVLMAQGEYADAIEVLRMVAEQRPGDRTPWVEISRIQRENLHDPMEAIATLHAALQESEWSPNDRAFFHFRMADVFSETINDRPRAAGLLRKVIEEFPDTRHAANARHQLQEWGMS